MRLSSTYCSPAECGPGVRIVAPGMVGVESWGVSGASSVGSSIAMRVPWPARLLSSRRPPMASGQAAGDDQAEAGALDAGGLLAEAYEGLEQPGHLRVGQAGAVVLDHEGQRVVATGTGGQAHRAAGDVVLDSNT